MPSARYAAVGSSYYGILSAVMAVVVILSNIGGVKGVQFGPIVTDAAFFLFPFAYIAGDVVSEVYGFRAARRAIVTTFVLSLFASLSYWLMICLPGFPTSEATEKQQAFETLLGPVPQLVAGSLLAFLAGQLTNSLIVVRLKGRQGERKLWVRLVTSSGVGEFVDTLIFCVVAAPIIGISTASDFVNYFVVGFAYKISVQYALVPATSWFIRWVKSHESSYAATSQ